MAEEDYSLPSGRLQFTRYRASCALAPYVRNYGMAAAQAQHVVNELGALLTENGSEVRYCVHPVAGRMPRHMNVLLAEANVEYDQLVEPQDVNPTIEIVDVAVVIGANDVVNPAAREDENSPPRGHAHHQRGPGPHLHCPETLAQSRILRARHSIFLSGEYTHAVR